jgi:mono/diheme cytochrome c family protein
MVRKILLGIVLVVVVFIAGFAAFVASRQHLKFVAPDIAVAASTDSTVIARGHYIVRRVTNCAGCHGDTTKSAALLAGEDVPLCGGSVFDIPPGKFYPRNITPDNETGIGTFTDKQLAQALRYGIGHDGRALLPFMELQGLSDEDIVAVISYLRSQPAVHNLVPCAPTQRARPRRDGDRAGQASRAQGAAAAPQSAWCDDRERSLPGRIRRAVRVLSHGAQSGDRAVHGTEIRRGTRFREQWQGVVVAAEHHRGRADGPASAS